MAKIPFDIKFRPQIESGEYKVVTGDGRPVKIVCWEREVKVYGRFVIVGLIPTLQGDTEMVQLYCPDGTLIASSWNEKFKLFLVTPEPELTVWEKFISGCLQKHGLLDCGGADRIAKECSSELLELARKELEPEVLERLDAAYKNQDEVVYRKGKRDGKAEALKDLPRWRRCGKDTLRNYGEEHFEYRGGVCYLVMKGREILLSDLEKLPGFNE